MQYAPVVWCRNVSMINITAQIYERGVADQQNPPFLFHVCACVRVCMLNFDFIHYDFGIMDRSPFPNLYRSSLFQYICRSFFALRLRFPCVTEYSTCVYVCLFPLLFSECFPTIYQFYVIFGRNESW